MLDKKRSCFILISLLINSSCFAEELFNANSDILGLNLSMSRDKMIQVISDNFYLIDKIDNKVQFKYGEHTTPVILNKVKLSITNKNRASENIDSIEKEKNRVKHF